MVEIDDDGHNGGGGDGWSSEEEEMNFGGTANVTGLAAIRSATFVDNNQRVNGMPQPVSSFIAIYICMSSSRQQILHCCPLIPLSFLRHSKIRR